ncbi:MAG: glycosyltransferase family 4 protein [Clostridia bacterium]|nr:glycosyltransferase family 4 protein [Clostridia bacterium]
MRILMMNQFPLTGGGSGFYTKNIAKSLTALGHEVCIIIPENTTKIEKIDGVIIKPVFFKRREIIEGQLPFNFGCFTTHPRSNMTFNKYTDSQLEMYIKAFERAIEEVIKDFKPDIIHSGHIWILSNIASKYNIPTIITSHGTDIIGHNMWDRFHKYSNEAIERCSKVITISDSNKEDVLTAFPNAKNKVIQLRNGYDQNIFERKEYNKEEILKEIGINKEYKNIVLFSGRLVKIKGIDVLLKAAKRYEDGNTLTLIAGRRSIIRTFKRTSRRTRIKGCSFFREPNPGKFKYII